MAIEQQFVGFLIDRIDVKLGDIHKQTSGETAQLVVEETRLFLDQLREALNTILSVEMHPIPETSAPIPTSGRGRGRGNRGESA